MSAPIKLHDFRESLEWSHSQAKLDLWEKVYRQAFPTFLGMQYLEKNGWAQYAAIDRYVFLEGGKVLSIDEKIRKEDYQDFLLEYWSDLEHKKPGWIAKDSACDYIAYAFLPSRRCYLLPFQQLRRCWKSYKEEWVKKYRPREAKNLRYTTVSVPIPIDVLTAAIKDTMLIRWDDGEEKTPGISIPHPLPQVKRPTLNDPRQGSLFPENHRPD